MKRTRQWTELPVPGGRVVAAWGSSDAATVEHECRNTMREFSTTAGEHTERARPDRPGSRGPQEVDKERSDDSTRGHDESEPR